jgi:type I phosphodiesterase/nucleotide pyrophosphatase
VTDVDRLLTWFDAGELLRPDHDSPNLLQLSRALARLCGVDGIEETDGIRRIEDAIGRHDHYILVLVDGMGMHLVDRLPPADPLRAALAMELQTVFPSSTAPALTTLATALPPAQHAVPGWWTYLPDAAVTATILPFSERFSEAPLGIDVSSAFPAPVMPARFRRGCFWVSPKPIAGSVYSRYSSGDAPHTGYRSLTLAIEIIERRIAAADAPTYTYFYIPFIDTAEHDHGPDAPQVTRMFANVRRRLRLLTEALRGRARIIVTADHGQVGVSEGHRHILDRGDPLVAMLRHPPSCEPRASAFHVRDGARERFAAAFRERLGDRFALLTVDEVSALRLLGPTPLSAETHRRLGDFMAFPRGLDVILYEPKPKLRAMKGFHGGLTRDEMRIPLILA